MRATSKTTLERLRQSLDLFFKKDVEDAIDVSPNGEEEKAFLKSVFEQSQLFDAVDEEKAWQRFEEKTRETENVTERKPFSILKTSFKYAAIVAGILFGFFIFRAYENTKISSKNNTVAAPEKNIQLIIDGEKPQAIDISKNIEINSQKGQLIAVQDKDVLNYKAAALPFENTVVMNKVKVPYGKAFKIVLSDGTKVHCDAGTQISFPSKFPKSGFREVSLKGQAFFEVTKNPENPFKVHVKNVHITVLGTKFNISAYDNDYTIATTLTEGHVEIRTSSTDLVPFELDSGQLALFHKGTKKMKVKAVDVKVHTAWLQGQLYFEQMPFASILKILERKFDVTILNKNKLLHRKIFTAKFSDESLDDILKSFQIESDFTFRKENNNILIN